MGSRIKESPEFTFEVYVEVTHPGTTGSDPEVRRLFPEDYIDQETLQTLTKFCFPFNADSLTLSQVGQNFTFVLTDMESKQRFGFCRLSSGARSCFCILSYLPWFEVFYKLLNILADYSTKGQDSQQKELLERLHTLPVPEPGVPVHLSVHSYFTVPDIRELPSIPENRNLTEYFVAVDVNNMLHLYASMLYERRIIICCSKLSTLTACVHGSAAMLYPMYWQHVYIPVLPQHLIDYCCAPMPYLIGVHSSLMEKVKGMVLEDVVMLNVDTNTLETPFDDLQSLPNDVVSSLKNRLKKVSTTTGDGVARAFLKAQAALFGSYRNALKIEPEEPITFSEEAFVAHRSSGMRQFLQSAIQLQLFKQFIDGRLELLNSGEGFSDVFEEEINMGEYAGSDKTYHQWLSTVKKGSGAIFNTVKTKANPAMKTVYKFAKDHARMGIKEVKNRLKQKDMTENGYAVAGEDIQQHTADSPSTERKEVRPREERRPITVHFGQARPPRPLVVKRPRSNVTLDTRRTSASSPEQPQPYRTLKEADLAEVEEGQRPERVQGHTAPPSPVADKISELSFLDDLFGLEGELESQTLTLAKSLEDLRTPKDPDELREQAKFSYQRMDLMGSERTRTLPTIKHSNPYNKLWSLGQDDMALPCISTQSWDRPLPVPPPEPSEPTPSGLESSVVSQDKVDSGGVSQSCITIPRPQGRKTPELGKVLGPPGQLPRAPKLPGTADPASLAESGVSVGGQEFRQALNMSPLSSQRSSPDVQKPTQLSSDSMDLLSLLDPLNAAEGPPASQPLPAHPGPTLLSSVREDSGTVPAQRVYPQPLPPFPHISLNPFTQSLPYPTTAPLHRQYLSPGGNPFSSAYMPAAGYFQTFPYGPPGLYRQPSPGAPGFLQQSPVQVRPAFPPTATHPPAPVPSPRDTPPALTKPPTSGEDKVSQEPAQDPFGDLLPLTKPAAAPKRRVEDLRRRWETFD
ncbi:hypothetical protein GJAV_G00030280 [Gymnothorax javanicus]|nr:hypothetical protein GJAV_G00030280 [Gymnothorax javanicus]